jgi:hypothetical protein
MPRFRFALAVFLLLLFACESLRADIDQARSALYASYREKLEQVAKRCDTENLPAAAQAIRAWVPKRDPEQLTLFLPPSEMFPAADADSPANQVRWQELRNSQADALVALAKQALDEHRPSLVMELVVEALRENPDHERARKMLGYVKYQDAWRTPFEARQLRAGKVWHERFGWLPKAHLERYERGERNALGRWMTADEEAALRSDMQRGWRVETDHYVVTTNHSLEKGVELARRLELLHALWRQVFATYLASEQELVKQLNGKAPKPLPRQHDVFYFRSRDEYVAALKSAQPQIEITLGIYFDTTRKAYFFAGEEQDPGTLFHEGAHQLLQETRNVTSQVGAKDNFWIVEAIACYMESLAAHDGYYTLGGANSGRVPAARHRILTDQFYVPLIELTAMGRQDLQRDPRIAMIYSQSAGLADFFMHSSGGARRDSLNRYLAFVYAGRAKPQTLAELMSESFESLDGKYRAFMSDGAKESATAAR